METVNFISKVVVERSMSAQCSEHISLGFSTLWFRLLYYSSISQGNSHHNQAIHLLCLAPHLKSCTSFYGELHRHAMPCSKASHGSVQGRGGEVGCLDATFMFPLTFLPSPTVPSSQFTQGPLHSPNFPGTLCPFHLSDIDTDPVSKATAHIS